jgi:transcriptional regulator with PAS, ATPase and Fis domain
MKKFLFSWIGRTDLRAVTESETIGIGPIAQALTALDFDKVLLLNNYAPEETAKFIKWLKQIKSSDIQIHDVRLTSPTNFGEIFRETSKILKSTYSDAGQQFHPTFHLSPGTPAMAAVWILHAKSFFPAELLESSREAGVQVADVPFDISAEFIPSLLEQSDTKLERLSEGLPPDAAEFNDIVHRSPAMKRVLAKAHKVAPRSVPVLIEGESGTGKELLARAIHNSSPRKASPFIAVNCGAIPPNLLEAELFGSKKGSYTGATSDRTGYFEAANHGTLFLDEIGELPPEAQVKILRTLQEGEVVMVGDTSPRKINVRVIAATNRSLIEEVSFGNFRADLFYRIAVAILKLPALRDRAGDISLLIDTLLEKINKESAGEPGYKSKKISPNAKNLMIAHPWPGNVRELLNTLLRAAVWANEETIGTEDIRETLLPAISKTKEDSLGEALSEPVNLQEIIGNLCKSYLKAALDKAGGNKTKAAHLLGLPNYQTLTNWLKKYGVDQ